MASEGFIHNPTNQKTRKGNNKMKVNSKNTALVVTDPQNDFLSPEGVTWGMVGKNVTKNISTMVKLW